MLLDSLSSRSPFGFFPYRFYDFIFLFVGTWFGTGLPQLEDAKGLVRSQLSTHHCLVEVSPFPFPCINEYSPRHALWDPTVIRRFFHVISKVALSRPFFVIQACVFLAFSLAKSECSIDIAAFWVFFSRSSQRSCDQSSPMLSSCSSGSSSGITMQTFFSRCLLLGGPGFLASNSLWILRPHGGVCIMFFANSRFVLQARFCGCVGLGCYDLAGF